MSQRNGKVHLAIPTSQRIYTTLHDDGNQCLQQMRVSVCTQVYVWVWVQAEWVL